MPNKSTVYASDADSSFSNFLLFSTSFLVFFLLEFLLSSRERERKQNVLMRIYGPSPTPFLFLIKLDLIVKYPLQIAGREEISVLLLFFFHRFLVIFHTKTILYAILRSITLDAKNSYSF